MDNLKYYNDSLAYDFDLFMPKPKIEKKDNVIKMPQTAKKKKARTKKQSRALSLSVTTVLISVFFLTILCGNIYMRIRINEVDSEINDINATINELDAQYTALNMEYEKIVSYNNLETAATELGMKKMDKDQIVYIQVNDKDAAITSDGEKTVSAE